MRDELRVVLHDLGPEVDGLDAVELRLPSGEAVVDAAMSS